MKRPLAMLTLLLTASCATQPEPCTAEWFDWKTERFFDEFVRDHRDDIVELRSITLRLNGADGRSIDNLATMASAAAKAVNLTGDFLSDTVPAINNAVSQCGTPPKATQLFASLLRREGFDERAVKAIEDLGVLLGENAG
jgi:hypothetical protein